MGFLTVVVCMLVLVLVLAVVVMVARVLVIVVVVVVVAAVGRGRGRGVCCCCGCGCACCGGCFVRFGVVSTCLDSLTVCIFGDATRNRRPGAKSSVMDVEALSAFVIVYNPKP